MRRMFFVIGAISVLSTPAHSQVVSWQGVGPVRLGMTVDAAERALKARLKPRDIPYSDDCWLTERADGEDGALSYVIWKGKIAVISVNPPKGQKTSLTDTRGIGIDATEADIRRAYGQVKITRAPYEDEESEIQGAKTRAELGIKMSGPEEPPNYWVEVESPNHERAIIYDTQGSRIKWMRTGLKPIVTNAELCQ
jgi:hypothetical protein